MDPKILHYGFVGAMRRNDSGASKLEIETKEFQDVGMVKCMPDKCFFIEALGIKLRFKCVNLSTNTHAADILDSIRLDSKHFDCDLC